MSYWNYPQSMSMTASKYLKYNSASNRPFEPGQRYRSRLDMEYSYPEYRQCRRDIRAASEEIEYRRNTSPERHVRAPSTFRNNPIGYTSTRAQGNTWNYSYYPSIKSFSPCMREGDFDHRLKNLYRYYGTKVYY